MRAATSGSGVATSTSTTCLPRSSSRTAPPTRYASTPATAVRMRLSIDDPPFRPAWVGDHARRDLVVDRAGMARVRLDQNAVAHEGHGRTLRLVAELNRERVHRDRSDDAPARARHEHFGSGQPAPEAVPVADRDEADASLPLCDEAAPVAGAVAASQDLGLGDVAPPGQ